MSDMGTPESVLGPEIDDFLGEEEQEEDHQQEGAEEQADADPEAEEVESDEEQAEDADGEEEAAPKFDPPHSWSKEEKEVFAKLDPAAQAVIHRRESERDKFVQLKSVEAAQTRDKVANEAREIIVRQHEDYALKLSAYAQQIVPQAPDERLLYSGNPDDVIVYQRQMAAYQRGTDQQQQLHQQIEQARAAAESAREQSQQAERASDAQRLQEQLPDWFDPSSGPKLRDELQSIGAELGYPTELMAEASSTDILALKRAAEWKADAEKYRKLIGKKMETVRAAKGLPNMARPGVKPSKSQATAAASQRNWDRVKSNPKDANAFADFLGL